MIEVQDENDTIFNKDYIMTMDAIKVPYQPQSIQTWQRYIVPFNGSHLYDFVWFVNGTKGLMVSLKNSGKV